MHGRAALSVLAVSLLAAGCGAERPAEPATIQIIDQAPAGARPATIADRKTVPSVRRARAGKVRTGTFRAPARLKTPAPSGARHESSPTPAPPASRRKGAAAEFRRDHLRALRVHCRTRPVDDPRCAGTEVDERVALAAFETQPER